MLIPYSLPLETRGKPGTARRWNDPVRDLYPHHAEFWPADIPEHHLLRQRHLRLARKRRRLMLLKALRWCFGRSRIQRRSRAAKPPRLPNVARHFHQRETQASIVDPGPVRITQPLSAAGCHGDCR